MKPFQLRRYGRQWTLEVWGYTHPTDVDVTVRSMPVRSFEDGIKWMEAMVRDGVPQIYGWPKDAKALRRV